MSKERTVVMKIRADVHKKLKMYQIVNDLSTLSDAISKLIDDCDKGAKDDKSDARQAI
jgi:hypothetical protein